jgi:hypothetical protein
MKWKIGIIAIAALLLFAGAVVAAEKQAGNNQNNRGKNQYQLNKDQPMPGGNGVTQ